MIITTINNIVWSNALVVLCFISGIYFVEIRTNNDKVVKKVNLVK